LNYAIENLKKDMILERRRLMETQIFHHAKIYNLPKKKSLKRNQNPSRYYNSIITNLKFQQTSQNIMSKISFTKN
jgi:hypothetical protein